MTNPTRIAGQYLRPPLHSFWQWHDDGQVLAWLDGTTIAFRAELEQVLRRLARQGLPPLGSVALLLAACRDSWPEASSQFHGLVQSLTFLQQARLGTLYSEVLNGLQRVHALPEELRSTPQAKVELAAMVFEDCSEQMADREESKAVLEALAQGAPDGPRESFAPRSQSATDLLWSLEALRRGLARLDPESLALRRKTGLDQLVGPAKIDAPPGARGLIAQLLDDQELGGVARLARNLMAAVSLPRPIAEREDLPLGGVSDISNRGPLDRLLLSELAHDDLTLAVRVAVNEALYLRREAPPRNPPRWRAILIDSGLRMWGIPRVFATAVALALTATTDPKTRVVAFRTAGDQIEPSDLETREGLVRHLAALDPAAHPGEALPAFVEMLQGGENEADPVLITGEDVLADRRFQQALAAADLPLVYVATVSREGRFLLVARGLRGTRPIREARLNLNEVLAPSKRPVVPLVRKNVPKDLPAVCRVEPFPLRLPHQVDLRRAWSVERYGLAVVARDRRLMLWDGPDRGARQLSDGVPKGFVLSSAPAVEDDVTWAVIGYEGGPASLLSVNLETGQLRTCPLEVSGKHRRAILGHAGMLLAIYGSRVDVLEMEDGRRVQSLNLPHDIRWNNGRFFRSTDGWLALAYDGMNARLEPLPKSPQGGAKPWLVTMFDCLGRDGPLASTPQGNLYDCARGELIPLKQAAGAFRLIAMTPDGHRVILERQGAGRGQRPFWCLDVNSGEITEHNTPIDARLAMLGAMRLQRRRYLGYSPMRWRFTEAIVSLGRLILVSRRGFHWEVAIDPAQARTRLVPRSKGIVSREARAEFIRVPSPPGTSYRLRMAQWRDGSRAWIDSRGLLHLKSGNLDVPEMSLVLADGGLAGWCSDGRVFGAPYYLGGQPASPESEIYEEVLKPFVTRIGL